MAGARTLPEETTPSTRAGRPRRFGRYTLVQKIGHGGMATLYLGRLDGPLGFEKFLAVKRIHPHLAEEKQFVRMFLDEARIAARIQHPNVVQIFELGEVSGEYFFAMEYLQGESLASLMNTLKGRKEPPPFELMAHVIARAADGLHAAHELRGLDGEPLGLVHRDVSPQNVLVTYDGLVKVLDFGIAKATGRLAQTATGELKGKYAYMAPEQVTGGSADRRADIFALGVVLYECTTLTRLFKADNELLTLDKIMRHEIRHPRLVVPGYPKELVEIVHKALEKDPRARYQTAAELSTELDAYAATLPDPVGAPALTKWMGERFAVQAEEKRRMLEVARTLAAGVGSTEEEARPRRAWIWLSAALATLVALGATMAALVLFRADGGGPTTGTVRITSTPVEGDVFFGERGKVGRTPLEVDGLELGRYEVRVVAEGHEPTEAAFVIQRAGQYVTLAVPLEPEAPDTGILEVGGPAGLSLSVDGRQLDSATPTKVELPPGEHRVVLGGEGLVPFEQRVTIQAGRTVLLAPPPMRKVSSEPREGEGPGPGRPPPQRFGYLTLSSSPWAEVHLGGKRLGTTPLNKVKLPAGRRVLRLVPEGSGPPKSITVTIRPDETTRQFVSL